MHVVVMKRGWGAKSIVRRWPCTYFDDVNHFPPRQISNLYFIVFVTLPSTSERLSKHTFGRINKIHKTLPVVRVMLQRKHTSRRCPVQRVSPPVRPVIRPTPSRPVHSLLFPTLAVSYFA